VLVLSASHPFHTTCVVAGNFRSILGRLESSTTTSAGSLKMASYAWSRWQGRWWSFPFRYIECHAMECYAIDHLPILGLFAMK
jgi:hypothetical protein